MKRLPGVAKKVARDPLLDCHAGCHVAVTSKLLDRLFDD